MSAGHEVPKSSPPLADYERPKAVEPGEAKPLVPPPAPVVLTLLGGDEPIVVRAVLAPSEDGVWSATLAHEYEGVEFDGLTFEHDGKMFEVMERKASILALEVA